MTTTVAISFPWGMYHATPWARNVNEGAVEWPPSPWRILRALYATWQTRAPHLEEQVVHRLLSELSGLPEYTVPPFVESHTRHYMPDMKYKRAVEQSTDKVIDSFVVTERDAQVGVSWPVDLDDACRSALAELASLLPYLGRAESICEAHLLDEGEVVDGVVCCPLTDPTDPEPIRLLAPQGALALDSLIMRTADVRKGNRLDPPGTFWVDYAPLREFRAAPSPRRHVIDHPTAFRWSIAENAPRPSVHAAVTMADALRRAAMSKYGDRQGGGVSEVLAGKDSTGRPLRGHGHAHYLALDLDGDRLLDTVIMWAPAGLAEDEMAALGELRRLSGHSFIRDFRPCRLGLEGFGDAASVIPELVSSGSTRWVSHTPFAPARHGRRRDPWDAHVAQEVRRELTYRSFAEPKSVQVMRGDWLSYRRHRLGERLEDSRRAIGIEIEFPEPVTGPVVLGALSHFSLGILVPKP